MRIVYIKLGAKAKIKQYLYYSAVWRFSRVLVLNGRK